MQLRIKNLFLILLCACLTGCGTEVSVDEIYHQDGLKITQKNYEENAWLGLIHYMTGYPAGFQLMHSDDPKIQFNDNIITPKAYAQLLFANAKLHCTNIDYGIANYDATTNADVFLAEFRTELSAEKLNAKDCNEKEYAKMFTQNGQLQIQRIALAEMVKISEPFCFWNASEFKDCLKKPL